MIVLQLGNIVLSLIGIYYWWQLGRKNLSLKTPVWWPIALLVSNTLFSVAVIVDSFVFDFITPQMLNYWGQGVRIQLAITLIVGVRLMLNLRTNGRKK